MASLGQTEANTKKTVQDGVDRADQYLSHNSLLRKTVKWTNKVALWLINCALYNSFRIHKILNPAKQFKYKIFLLQVAKAWANNKMEAAESDRQTQTQCDRGHQLLPHAGLMWTPLGNFRVICGNLSS
jgi:hypothetical protein